MKNLSKKDLPLGTKVIARVDDEEYGNNDVIKYYVSDYDDYTLNGTVVDNSLSETKPTATQVIVSWDENDWREEEEEVVDIDLLTLESDLPTIEKEFKAAMKAVKKKVKEAAKLVEEANTMAVAAHAKSLESLWDVSSPLINAMDNAGWRSSSWGC